jgi:hypothetical protein
MQSKRVAGRFHVRSLVASRLIGKLIKGTRPEGDARAAFLIVKKQRVYGDFEAAGPIEEQFFLCYKTQARERKS